MKVHNPADGEVTEWTIETSDDVRLSALPRLSEESGSFSAILGIVESRASEFSALALYCGHVAHSLRIRRTGAGIIRLHLGGEWATRYEVWRYRKNSERVASVWARSESAAFEFAAAKFGPRTHIIEPDYDFDGGAPGYIAP